MSGRTCIVTGASSGLGKATALGLSALGGRVIVVCRERASGEETLSEIIDQTRNNSVFLMTADLASQDSILGFTREFKKRFGQLHVLLNIAGIHLSERSLTPERMESTFAVNYLAPFLLTNLLVDSLKSSAPSRVVNVVSWTERQAQINFGDLQGESKFNGVMAYNQSKLALVMFTYELARKLSGSGVTVNCIHPGVAKTNLGRNAKGFFRLFLTLARPFFSSPEKAASAIIRLASDHELETTSGKYFDKYRVSTSSKKSYDLLDSQRLWGLSMKFTNQVLARPAWEP